MNESTIIQAMKIKKRNKGKENGEKTGNSKHTYIFCDFLGVIPCSIEENVAVEIHFVPAATMPYT